MTGYTTEILFALLHCGLTPTDKPAATELADVFARNEPIDWKSVYKAAALQGVLAIAWDGLQRFTDAGLIASEHLPDKTVLLQWAYNVQVIADRYRKQEKVIGKLAGFYASYGIDMMVLKGYGLSLGYPVPEHRPCGDIDIWLYGRQSEADEVLHREMGVAIDEDKHHHTVFYVDDVMVENHFDILNVESHLSNRDLERHLQSLLNGPSEKVSVCGSDISLPSPDFNALFLLRHTAAHYAAERIGLRHIADWAMFVRRYGAEVDWAMIERISREHNMHKFLHCLYFMTAECCGVSMDNIPAFERDEKLECRVLNDILNPEFAERMPDKGLLRRNWYKLRRWWANRWKHRIVYRENLFTTFVVQIVSHLLKPASLK